MRRLDAYVVRVEDDAFVVTSVHGSPLHLLTGERLPLRRDLVTGRAILEARTVHVPDILAESDTDYAAAKAIRSRSGYRTMLAAPLLQRGAAIGAIGVGRQDVRPFTDEQVRLLETFADQAVIAIENTRLFEDLEARNRALTEALERQAATGEVLQIISSSPNRASGRVRCHLQELRTPVRWAERRPLSVRRRADPLQRPRKLHSGSAGRYPPTVPCTTEPGQRRGAGDLRWRCRPHSRRHEGSRLPQSAMGKHVSAFAARLPCPWSAKAVRSA